MRKRRYISSLRTGGRAYRNSRRHVAREAAAGRTLPPPDRQNAYEVVKLMRGMYTHIKAGDARTCASRMNRVVTQGERERDARAKAFSKAAR